MDRIYKTLSGRYIDLSRIVSVSAPYSVRDEPGVEINFQLMEKPVYDWTLPVDGLTFQEAKERHFNDIVEAWKKYKE